MAQDRITAPLKLLIIGGSAGSLTVLLKVLPALNYNVSLSIVIVVHRKNTPDSTLADLLASRTKIHVKEIEDKESLLGGTIYLAPPDYHILFENNGAVSLDFSEKVNFSRPSIDVAFESAAEVYKERLTCILLSGASSDGVKGLAEVKRNNGNFAVQDPSTAQAPYMPQQAVNKLHPNTVLTPEAMIGFINGL